ncbi:hypothetical protein L1887_18180 [Cichorium endivia]|nr:hypothetical protein L1887_18180 [Cichorium endivia]
MIARKILILDRTKGLGPHTRPHNKQAPGLLDKLEKNGEKIYGPTSPYTQHLVTRLTNALADDFHQRRTPPMEGKL